MTFSDFYSKSPSPVISANLPAVSSALEDRVVFMDVANYRYRLWLISYLI